MYPCSPKNVIMAGWIMLKGNVTTYELPHSNQEGICALDRCSMFNIDAILQNVLPSSISFNCKLVVWDWVWEKWDMGLFPKKTTCSVINGYPFLL